MTATSPQVALVTGASRGIGRELVALLAREGYQVALAARNLSTLQAVQAFLPKGTVSRCYAVDLSDGPSTAQLVPQVCADFGGLDILINNAGVAHAAPLRAQSNESWDSSFALNLRGPFVLARMSAREMKKKSWGRIINIASTAGLRGYPYTAAYVASKHGVIGMTRAMALEFGPQGTTVNAICPGFVDTDIARDAAQNIAAKTGRPVAEAKAELASDNPIGRLIEPAEVAAAVMHFLDEKSQAISGQALVVNGAEL